MDALSILVVILSSFLAIFLLLGIVLTVILIKITQQIKHISSIAEDTALKAQSVVTNVNTATSVKSMTKVAKAFAQGFKKNK